MYICDSDVIKTFIGEESKIDPHYIFQYFMVLRFMIHVALLKLKIYFSLDDYMICVVWGI